MLPTVSALALLGLSGCAAPAWVVVSDLHGDKVVVADLARGREAWRVDVDDALPDACKVADDEGRFCLVYQSRHRVDADGHDEIAFTVTPAGHDGDPYDPRNVATIQGVRASDPVAWRWSVDRLDFSQVDPDGALCARDPADPCAPAPGQDADAARRCQLYWPHDFAVLGEDDDGLSLVVADTRNRRVLWLDAPREEGACAVVAEVLGDGNADWDVYASVNSLEVWEDGGARHLLATIKDTSPGDQDGGDGRGKVVRFEDAGDGWAQRWEFPPESTEAASFVNAPHGVAHDADRVYFAHSLGRAAAWNEGEGGSVGVLSLDGAYLFDGVLPEGDLLWPRDVAPLGDGRLALVDSGAKGAESAPAATRLYVVELGEDVAPSGLGGTWTADGSDQAFRALDVRADPDFGDGWVYYSAEPLGALGVDLAGLR